MTRIDTTIIREMDDADLDKELAFAEGFAFEDADGRAWLDALRQEKARRDDCR